MGLVSINNVKKLMSSPWLLNVFVFISVMILRYAQTFRNQLSGWRRDARLKSICLIEVNPDVTTNAYCIAFVPWM